MKHRFAAVAVALLVAACSGGTAGVAAVDLNILAAASLKGALDAAKTTYEASHAGVTLAISTDSSVALETKIEQGAPADVFLSADSANPQKLVDGGFATGDAVVFAGNELTVIVPKVNPADIASPADLAKAGVRIIGAGEAVPITRYAKLLVQNLAREAGYPAGFEAAYLANVVSMEENVKAVVAKIALGQGDAAIVYRTDAKGSTDVLPIDVPPTANVAASYAGVIVKASANPAAAQGFLDWLAGSEGQAVLATFGFLPPA